VICSAPASWLQRRGISTWLSILVVIVGILIIGSVLTSLVGASIKDFLIALPGYNRALDRHFEGIIRWLEQRGLDVGSFKITDAFEPAAVMQLTANLLSSLKDVLANGLLILLTVIFMLLEAVNIPGKLNSILDSPDETLPHFEKFSKDVRHYLAIKTWMCLLTGFLVTVFLMALGIDYPILWGLLAFLLNYIPTIGSIIAAVPAVLLTLIQLGAGWAVGVAVGYIVVNLIVGNLLEPRVMGKGLGLSTLVVFLSLVFWGWVLGPVGMVLSVPLTVTVRIALESREDTRWIAVILGSSQAPSL
jgi:predicted PurR-regulated permease PerM